MLPDNLHEPDSFADGPIAGVEIRELPFYGDDRGWLVELFRNDELPPENRPAMAYVSATLPGAVRGPHHHRHQSDCFAFLGPGELTLFLWDVRAGSATWGRRMRMVLDASNRQTVIVPPGVVHAYRNDGDVPAWIFNAANRLYAGEGKRAPVDEVRHEDRAEHPYRMD